MMANNRMYLRCTVCNQAQMIAKTLCDGWYTHDETGQRLEEFLSQHWHWDEVISVGTGPVADHFDVVFEHHPTREWKP